MKKITNWSMKRAGAGITITGVDSESGLVTKVVGVKQVELAKNPGGGKMIIADTGTDAKYQLITF